MVGQGKLTKHVTCVMYPCIVQGYLVPVPRYPRTFVPYARRSFLGWILGWILGATFSSRNT